MNEATGFGNMCFVLKMSELVPQVITCHGDLNQMMGRGQATLPDTLHCLQDSKKSIAIGTLNF